MKVFGFYLAAAGLLLVLLLGMAPTVKDVPTPTSSDQTIGVVDADDN